jgi:hypothetical protein
VRGPRQSCTAPLYISAPPAVRPFLGSRAASGPEELLDSERELRVVACTSRHRRQQQIQRVTGEAGQTGTRCQQNSDSAEDNKATEQKTEQTALASSPGLVHHSKMGAESYTLPSAFELPTDSSSGPAGPIAVNAPAAKIQDFGTSSKDTSTVDYSSGRMSPSAAGVAGKPRTQRQGKSADQATKDKPEGKDNKSGPTPSYQPVRQELPCDSDSEGVRSVISSVKYPQPRIDRRTSERALLQHHAVRQLELGPVS